jgi:hypothetical protein
MLKAEGSLRGCLLSSMGIVGSLYVRVSASKWSIVWISGKGPVRGSKLWYQCGSGKTRMVRAVGS